jgi:hypothetical protein
VARSSPDSIPDDLRAAFRSAVQLYSDWMPSLPEPKVRFGRELHAMSAVCGLLDGVNDRLPDDLFEKLMSYRQKIVGDRSYRAAARCFLRLIEDRKRQCLRAE